MTTLVTIIHCITCVLIILVVLLQSGKGAEVSASFSGSSQSLFGASGGVNVFQKFTYIAAAIFFTTSLFLTIWGSHVSKTSVFDGAKLPEAAAPAAPPVTTPAAASKTATDPEAPAAAKPATVPAPAAR